MSNTEKVQRECTDCGATVELSAHASAHAADGEIMCDGCYHQDRKDHMLKVYTGEIQQDIFSRARALQWLQREDGFPVHFTHPRTGKKTWIMAADIQYGRGIGGEPDGWWIESKETVVELDEPCPECGFEYGRRSFKAHAGHHHCMALTCKLCGEGIELEG